MAQTKNTTHTQWQGHTGGGNFGQKALIIILKTVPLWLVYCLLALIVPFFMIFSHKGYKSIYMYLRQHFGMLPIRAFIKTYKNHFIFGQIVIDRFAIFAGKSDRFIIDIDGKEFFDSLNNKPEGFVIVSSHIGNYEIAGYIFKSLKKKFNTLVYSNETAIIAQNRYKMMKDNNISIIPVTNDMSHLFLSNAALQNGEILSAVADRHNGSTKSVECNFLNGKADFPTGIFMISAAFDAKALALFNIKISARKYRVFIRPLNMDTDKYATLSNTQKAEGMVKAYVFEVEEILKKFPEQWFNFYDFWKK